MLQCNKDFGDMAFTSKTVLSVSKGIAKSTAEFNTLRSLTGVQYYSFSTTATNQDKKNYKLLVVGGGCGGLATASMFSKKLGKGNVAVLEPSEVGHPD